MLIEHSFGEHATPNPSNLIDLTGKRFGALVVIERTQPAAKWGSKWLCRCDCGRTITRYSSILRNRKGITRRWSNRCGPDCYLYVNLVGKTYGRLTVLEPAVRKSGRRTWLCECSCADRTHTIVSDPMLKEGKIKSCGCLIRESLQRTTQNRFSERAASVHAAGDAACWALYLQYRCRARRKGLTWELSFMQAKHLFQQACVYSGHAPLSVTRYLEDEFVYNGIDRVDNLCGYTIDNAVTCCRKCNVAKSTMTRSEFIEFIRSAYEHIFCNGNLR